MTSPRYKHNCNSGRRVTSVRPNVEDLDGPMPKVPVREGKEDARRLAAGEWTGRTFEALGGGGNMSIREYGTAS